MSVFHFLCNEVKRNSHLIQMVKLGSFVRGKSVLKISFVLFGILPGDDGGC